MQFIIHVNPKIFYLTQFLQYAFSNKKCVSSDIECLFEISIQPDLLVEMGSCQSLHHTEIASREFWNIILALLVSVQDM